jgi:nucleotide-binding universal stress UspA family protein
MRAQRILCPVDFSNPSRRALHHAAALASRDGAVLHVLHVALAVPPVPLLMLAARPLAIDAAAGATAALQAFIARAALPREPIAMVREGAPAEVILACAASMAADLIVMGSHGRDGLGHLLFGSTAERVLHHAPCPTLIVPLHAEDPASVDGVRFARIVCAVDFSPASTRALGLALSMADDHGAELTLLHVVDALADDELDGAVPAAVRARIDDLTRAARERLHAAVPGEMTLGGNRARGSLREVVRYGRAAQVIPIEAGERHADLIVMGAQGHRGLGLLGIGSTTHAVVCRAACPVLTARP